MGVAGSRAATYCQGHCLDPKCVCGSLLLLCPQGGTPELLRSTKKALGAKSGGEARAKLNKASPVLGWTSTGAVPTG